MSHAAKLIVIIPAFCVLLVTSSCSCVKQRPISRKWQRLVQPNMPKNLEELNSYGRCSATVELKDIDSYFQDRTFRRIIKSTLSMLLKVAPNDFDHLKSDYTLMIFDGVAMESSTGLIFDTTVVISECYVVDKEGQVLGGIEIPLASITDSRLKLDEDILVGTPVTQEEIDDLLKRIEDAKHPKEFLAKLAERDGLYYPFDGLRGHESTPALEAYRRIILAEYDILPKKLYIPSLYGDPGEEMDHLSTVLYGVSKTAGWDPFSNTVPKSSDFKIKYIPKDDVIILDYVAIWLSSPQLNRDSIRVCYYMHNFDPTDKDPNRIQCEVPAYSYPVESEADRAVRDKYRELFKKAAAKQAANEQ